MLHTTVIIIALKHWVSLAFNVYKHCPPNKIHVHVHIRTCLYVHTYTYKYLTQTYILHKPDSVLSFNFFFLYKMYMTINAAIMAALGTRTPNVIPTTYAPCFTTYMTTCEIIDRATCVHNRSNGINIIVFLCNSNCIWCYAGIHGMFYP